jgi:3-oxoacyl-[acyl-carrier-protein] synthase-3
LRHDSIGISAISYVLPATTLDLPAAAARGLLDTPAGVLGEFGFHQLHVSDRPAYDLALDALRRLLAEADVEPECVDLLLYAGALPGSHFVDDGSALAGFCYPAARLQYECGMVRAAALGIAQGGCTGLMSAVTMAIAHLRAHPEASRVACVSADVLPAGAKREIIYNVVSDGACALLVERRATRNVIVAHHSITKGYYWHAGDSRNEIVASYFPTARAIVDAVLAKAGLGAAELAAVIPHNVSLRSWQILLPMLGIPIERLFSDNIARKGHVIAADNFINLYDAMAAGRVVAGDRLLLFNFGFGANWSCLVLAA